MLNIVLSILVNKKGSKVCITAPDFNIPIQGLKWRYIENRRVMNIQTRIQTGKHKHFVYNLSPLHQTKPNLCTGSCVGKGNDLSAEMRASRWQNLKVFQFWCLPEWMKLSFSEWPEKLKELFFYPLFTSPTDQFRLWNVSPQTTTSPHSTFGGGQKCLAMSVGPMAKPHIFMHK